MAALRRITALATRLAQRTPEQLREQYLIEVELAGRLRTADRGKRRGLYSVVYDELYRRVPHHPGLVRQSDRQLMAARVGAQLRLLRPFLTPSHSFLEIGAGDCQLALKVAEQVRRVVVVEVSVEKALVRLSLRDNMEAFISDGVTIGVEPGSITLAYRNQVIEHLHPEDVADHLCEVHRALAPGALYVCTTPHRYRGPSDISKHFEPIPLGMHLKEYTYRELSTLFRSVGFGRIRARVSYKSSFYLTTPLWPAITLERLLAVFPANARRWLARSRLLRPWFRICVVAAKACLILNVSSVGLVAT